ncbi:unnamed protein product [Aphanomyces euteiches]
MHPVVLKRLQQQYTMEARTKLLTTYDESPLGESAICESEGIALFDVALMAKEKDAYLTTRRNNRLSTLGGQGRPVAITFVDDLL